MDWTINSEFTQIEMNNTHIVITDYPLGFYGLIMFNWVKIPWYYLRSQCLIICFFKRLIWIIKQNTKRGVVFFWSFDACFQGGGLSCHSEDRGHVRDSAFLSALSGSQEEMSQRLPEAALLWFILICADGPRRSWPGNHQPAPTPSPLMKEEQIISGSTHKAATTH